MDIKLEELSKYSSLLFNRIAKIERASNMDGKDEYLLKCISEIIAYRKKVAIEILNSNNKETMKELENIYERCDWHLKEMIGL